MGMMRPGKMDRQIAIYRMTVSQDGYGGKVETPTLLATVYAERLEESGREYFRAAQVVPGLQAIWRIWWRDDVDATVRVVADGATYEVLRVSEVGRREGLDILAKRP